MRRTRAPAVLALGLLALAPLLVMTAVLALLGQAKHPCQSDRSPLAGPGAGRGGFVATAYGPPWGGREGDGRTATGLDLRPGQPALEVAVDPRVIPLRGYVHVTPNPFATRRAFYAGDTGGAILGRRLDIYDWLGRTHQETWGKRTVSVSAAAAPGAAGVLEQLPAPQPPLTATPAELCSEQPAAPLQLSAGSRARILPDGAATAPRDAPDAVKRAIAAANAIHAKPYLYGGGHGQSLDTLAAAYDCSSATSFVLHRAGLLGAQPEDSSALEQFGQPGPGRWITLYANSTHTWIVIAGLAFDTSGYGGPAIPAGSGPRWRGDPTANLRDGLPYLVRHPPGL